MIQLRVNEHILLRTLSARDAADLYDATDRSRPYLQKWLPWVEHITSVEDSLTFIKDSLKAYMNMTEIALGIYFEGRFVGVISYNRIDHTNKIASIGYWIAEDEQGQGIVLSATEAVIEYGFQFLLLNRIEIRMATNNEKSKAIPKRLGFTKEGIIADAEKLPNGYVDHILYRMLKRDWEN